MENEINSYLDNISPKVIRITEIIKSAIINKMPILLKHHADCDGYCGGFVMEKTILQAIADYGKSEKAAYTRYKRTPMLSPYYDLMDAMKDAGAMLEEEAKWGKEKPLIIVVDNGSTKSDLTAIKYLKSLGAKIVVIDHHLPTRDVDNVPVVDKYCECHLNPHLEGLGAEITAGMLCYEIGRAMYPETKALVHLPAMSAISDKSKGDIADYYLSLAEKNNYSKDFLTSLYILTDYYAYLNKFSMNREIFADLLGSGINRQKELLSIFGDDINKLLSDQLKIMKKHHNEEVIGNFSFITADLDKTTGRGFPSSAKATGMLFTYINDVKKRPCICIGHHKNGITLRINQDAGITVHGIMKHITETDPDIVFDGGGHELAGTIKFASCFKDKILEITKEYIKRKLR